MKLSDLYPRGTKLSEVPPLFEGMPILEYWRESIKAQYDRSLAQRARELAAAGEEPEINRKRIATSRDNYGWRSL